LDVDAISLAGIWYRQIPAGADPLYRPPHPADSRWQRGSIVDAIYLADSEPTAWAEWYRALAEAALPPGRALPRDLWRWQVDLPASAARPEGRTLCIFRVAHEITGVSPVPPPATVADPPIVPTGLRT
jgi:hypothetical protein